MPTTESRSATFEYAVRLPLRVFERRAIKERIASAAFALNNNFLTGRFRFTPCGAPYGVIEGSQGPPAGVRTARSLRSLAYVPLDLTQLHQQLQITYTPRLIVQP